MKALFTTVVTGPDNVEALRSLASETRNFDGEWLVLKKIKLDGRFAAIMRVSVPASEEANLKQALESAFPEFSFDHYPADQNSSVPTATIRLEIDCLDRPGLTRDISDYLNRLGLVVEHMESTRHPIGAVTSTMYSTRVTLAAPPEVEAAEIAERIESLSSNIKVTVV